MALVDLRHVVQQFILFVVPISRINAVRSVNRNVYKYQQAHKLHENGRDPPKSKEKPTKKVKRVLKYRFHDFVRFAKQNWYVVIPIHTMFTLSYMTLFYAICRKQTLLDKLKWLNYDNDDLTILPDTLKYFPNMSKRTLQDIAVTVILMKLSLPLRYASTVVASKFVIKLLNQHKAVKFVTVCASTTQRNYTS